MIRHTADQQRSEPQLHEAHQRVDKWLWHARVVRTRTAAGALAASGLVRRNGTRIEAASRAVKVGDVLTIALDGGVRLLKVLRLAERRGDAQAARLLYEDLGPAPAVKGASTELRQ